MIDDVIAFSSTLDFLIDCLESTNRLINQYPKNIIMIIIKVFSRELQFKDRKWSSGALDVDAHTQHRHTSHLDWTMTVMACVRWVDEPTRRGEKRRSGFLDSNGKKNERKDGRRRWAARRSRSLLPSIHLVGKWIVIGLIRPVDGSWTEYGLRLLSTFSSALFFFFPLSIGLVLVHDRIPSPTYQKNNKDNNCPTLFSPTRSSRLL